MSKEITKDLSKLSLEEHTRQELTSRLALLNDERRFAEKELLGIRNDIVRIELFLANNQIK